ncbi:undecaprenyldiphospho-muramoylpentapeptide beta-N-acetylglucosaminyltransferase [Patescibacteria group bacterium]|nr:undecaprenyldiphospho-muramoylpentapeptide beta-N-acetylglucosaminyltransferase [Patescibacteria group bacterium]
MRILLVGGGTGGPVMPLIAVQQYLKKQHRDAKFLLVGTNSGPEQNMAHEHGIDFVAVPAGKWRRYFSLANAAAPFLVFAGFFRAIGIIRKFRPDAAFAAGGYVAVPVILAAKLLKVKIAIHQQDVQPSLTNKILAPLADKITVSFEHSLKDFPSGSGFGSSRGTAHKVEWTGNPVMETLLENKKSVSDSRKELSLRSDFPVILVVGGATGAVGLNKIVLQALPELVKFAQVVHVTGAGKEVEFKHENYRQFSFVKNMSEFYSAADIVVCRAGLSTISELSALGKVSVVVPMPDSHQDYNALALHIKNAAVCIPEKALTGEILAKLIRKLLLSGEDQKTLSENMKNFMPKHADEKIATIITHLCQEKK